MLHNDKTKLCNYCWFLGLPGAYITNKIGERYTQCLAGVISVVSMIGTGFTREAWQGILVSGVLRGMSFPII